MSLRHSASAPLLVIALTLGLVMSTAAQSPAVPTPSPAPRPTPGTEPSPTGLGWVPVSLNIPGERWLTDLTAWAGGFAALESDHDGDLFALWTSPDGAVWERAPLPRGVYGGRIVGLRNDLYLVEPRDRGAQDLRIRTWRTNDGRAWHRQGLLDWRLPPSLGDDWRVGLAHIVAITDRLVVFGAVEPCCGAGGGVPLGTKYALIGGDASSVRVPLGGLVIWTSPDGKRWTRRSNRNLRDPESGDNAWVHPYGLPGGILAVRLTTDDALFASPDGVGWESIGPLPPEYEGTGPVELVTTDANVVMAFDDEAETLEVWLRGADGAWTQTLHEPSILMTGLVAAGTLVIVTGQRYDPGSDSWPRIIVSTDGGASWDPDLSWSGVPGGCVHEPAADGTRLVLLSCDDGRDTDPEPGTTTLWYADVPSTGTPG
jgi:hypothetical protein